MRVPNVLWAEAISHVVYTINRVNTKPLKETTPCELWTGRQPSIEHIGVFGCVAHLKVAKIYPTMLKDRSKKMVHLGIEQGTKAYWLLDPDTESICVSRNVIFEEDKEQEWEKAVKIKATPGMSFTIDQYELHETEETEVRSIPTMHEGLEYGLPQEDETWTEDKREPYNDPKFPFINMVSSRYLSIKFCRDLGV